jgi:hypothetical protein
MALETNINTLEKNKFVECNNETAVRTILCGTGTFVPAGLEVGGEVTHINIDGAQWYALPTTPKEDRKTLKVVNRSTTQTIYLEFNNTVATGDGDPIGPGIAAFFDFANEVIIYGSTGGATVKVTIVEGA